MNIRELQLGQHYYMVNKTKYGPVLNEYLLKSKMYNINAVFVLDKNNNEIKLYQEAIKYLLTEKEALIKFEKLKKTRLLNQNNKNNTLSTNNIKKLQFKKVLDSPNHKTNTAPTINLKISQAKKVLDLPTAEEIKTFLQKRNIQYLVHFTNYSNIQSIQKNGILARNVLDSRTIAYSKNDENRFDGLLSYISLSITKPNYKLLKAYKKRGSINRPVLIYIDAAILYNEIDSPRFYCDRNAAITNCRMGPYISDFENMFNETIEYTTKDNIHHCYNRKKAGRKDSETTDSQAEILFAGNVSMKYISKIEVLN